ncbi:MAG: hypothetical protein NTU85_01290 [Candidatus Kaiserbacteria bacterium]|nr:hypothetical protein [Candidatus Kaiserbacteria bacterium]
MNELNTISGILKPLGFSLDEQQPYMSGERYLAVGVAGGTFVLAGKSVNGTKVIIKASCQPNGKKEIESEKKARDLMCSLSFADKKIVLPEELYYGTKGEYVFLILRFISQEKVFVAHTIEEQFFIALSAFEAQESFHATTYGHLRAIEEVFPVLSAQEYFNDFERLRAFIQKFYPDESLQTILEQSWKFLSEHRVTIDRYANYLTHTDFVPHNFRLMEHTLYMLDCVPNYATIHFGNKYEGWARFLNYMMTHSPELERLLVAYVRDNRGEDEYLSLRLMRVYKIAFLLEFYARSLSKTTGDLHSLTLARLAYWREALAAILEDRPLAPEITERYIATRNTLRSEEEKERQREFDIA